MLSNSMLALALLAVGQAPREYRGSDGDWRQTLKRPARTVSQSLKPVRYDEKVVAAPINATPAVNTPQAVAPAPTSAPVVSSQPATGSMMMGGGCASGNCGSGYGSSGNCGYDSNDLSGKNVRNGHMFIRGEYLAWWINGDEVGSLITTSPNTPVLTPIAQAGVLGQPGTRSIYGGDHSDEMFQGFRIYGGVLLNECRKLWLDAGMFYFSPNGRGTIQPTDPTEIVSRPFFNTATGLEDAQLVNYPDVVNGTVSVDNGVDRFFGAEVNLRQNLSCNCPCPDKCTSTDWLVGYRHVNFGEHLNIVEDLTVVDPNGNIPVGTNIIVEDRYRTRNSWNGGQVGLVSTWWKNNWFAEVSGKFGLGANTKQVDVLGRTTTTIPGAAPAVNDGGLYVLPGQSGRHEETDISFLFDTGVNVGRRITRNVKVSVGYNLFVMTNVVRPGDVLNRSLDPAFLPPTTLTPPALTIGDSSLFAHGLSGRVQLQY